MIDTITTSLSITGIICSLTAIGISLWFLIQNHIKRERQWRNLRREMHRREGFIEADPGIWVKDKSDEA